VPAERSDRVASGEERLREAVASLRVSNVGKYEHFGRAIDRCESPIEMRLAVAFFFLFDFAFEPAEAPVVGRDRDGVEISLQVPVGGYRVDFAFTHACGAKLAIETDGHAFHDATPERAERDKSRDRELLEAGWRTARFTGAEIMRDPRECANQVYRIFAALIPSQASGPELVAPVDPATILAERMIQQVLAFPSMWGGASAGPLLYALRSFREAEIEADLHAAAFGSFDRHLDEPPSRAADAREAWAILGESAKGFLLARAKVFNREATARMTRMDPDGPEIMHLADEVQRRMRAGVTFRLPDLEAK